MPALAHGNEIFVGDTVARSVDHFDHKGMKRLRVKQISQSIGDRMIHANNRFKLRKNVKEPATSR